MSLTKSQKRSSVAIISSYTLTRIGDTLTNPKTILTWLLAALGAPAFIIGMLVPIRESGSMLPQIFISSFIKKFPARKPIYLVGLIGQGICAASMAFAAIFLPPAPAGYTILAALALFSIIRAFCSIASKDVLGRAIPKGTRGKLSGIASTISGILAATAAITILTNRDQNSPQLLAYIILGASTLWFFASVAYAFVHEPIPDNPTTDKDLANDLKTRLALIKNDKTFRHFIIARTLLLGTALASPIIVVIAQQNNPSASTLVSFIIAGAVASSISSIIWGNLSDKASHLAMALGGILAAITGVFAIIAFYSLPALTSLSYTWPALFLVFNIGYTGVRLGRKTWVVDATEGDQRTNYVSASNTIIAALIILLGLIAAPLQAITPILPLALYTLCCLTGATYALKLKIDPMQGSDR